jgi:hydroxymethylglutaryl-CoA reductase (NADPH)
MFPSFVLAKLYVKGSLKNTADGFEFSLKNIIDATMLSGIGPIVAGDQSYEGAALTAIIGDKQWRGDEVSKTNLVPVKMGVPLRVLVQGGPLPAGEVKLTITATTSDIGKVKFDVKDRVQA